MPSRSQILRFTLALFVAALVAFPAGVQQAQAAGFTVNSTTDAVDASPGDGVCATASLTGEGVVCTLRAAIMEANALGVTNTISLPAGTYMLTIPGDGEDAGATGDLDINVPLTITGASAATTIMDGNQLDRVVDVLPGAGNISMSNLTIRGGYRPGGNGAGIYDRTTIARLTIINGIVSDNHGAEYGGGIYADVVDVEDSIISNNSSIYGGGIGANTTGDKMTIRRSVIADNRGIAGGGGIYGVIVSISQSNITNNSTGGSGAGINSDNLSLLASTVSHNKIDENTGGLGRVPGSV